MLSKWIKAGKIVVLLGVIGLGGSLVIRSMIESGRDAERAIPVARWVACTSCGHHYRGEIATRPASCPACQSKTVWPAMQCTECGAIVAVDTFKFDKELREPYCQLCGSETLTRFRPGSSGADSADSAEPALKPDSAP